MPPGIIENADFQQITSGSRLISAQFAGFQLIETHHLPGAALSRHAHADASVNFVISGGLRETVGNLARRREYLCGPGNVLYKPAAEYHTNSYGPDGARCLIIQPSAARLQSLIDAEFDLDKRVWLLNFQHVDFSAGRHDDSAWRYSGICQHSDCEPLRCAAFSGPTTLG